MRAPSRRTNMGGVRNLQWALVAAVVLVGTACGTTATLDDGTLPPLGTGTFPPPSTSVATAGTTAPPTSAEPGGLPSTSIAGSSGTGIGWGGWDHDDVPMLGSESVRGSGCGSTGGIGEIIPDGVWSVIIGDGTGGDQFWSDDSMTVDMECVYTGKGGQQLWEAACLTDPQSPNCTQQTGDWYVVNANGRLRTVRVSPDVQYGVGALGTSPCPDAPTDRTASNAPWRSEHSWIVIQGGQVTHVVTDCPG